MDYEKKYNEALERARKAYNAIPPESHGARKIIEDAFPQLRESEKPLTPFQQCLNLILRKVYFASVRTKEDVDKFILDIVKNHTSELVELAKRYEKTDNKLRESEDERIRKAIVLGIKRCADAGSIFGTVINNEGVKYHDVLAWLEKQKEPHYTKRNALFDKCVENCDPAVMKEVSDEIDEMLQKEQKPELVQQPPITYTYNSNASRDERLKAALLALLNSDLLKVKEGGYFTKQDLIEWVEKQKPAEWSEEDEKMLNKILDSVTYAFYEQGKEGEIEDDPAFLWLHRLRPSWKPSEEQLNALNFAITYFMHETNYKNPTGLRDLYDDLLKLK